MASKEQIPVRSDESKSEALKRIRERWQDLPETKPEEVDKWLGGLTGCPVLLRI